MGEEGWEFVRGDRDAPLAELIRFLKDRLIDLGSHDGGWWAWGQASELGVVPLIGAWFFTWS